MCCRKKIKEDTVHHIVTLIPRSPVTQNITSLLKVNEFNKNLTQLSTLKIFSRVQEIHFFIHWFTHLPCGSQRQKTILPFKRPKEFIVHNSSG